MTSMELAREGFEIELSRARTGDTAGIEAFHRWLAQPLTAFASSRRAIDPEGAVNDAFTRVFARLDTFDGSSEDFRRWIFTIVRNLVIDQHRAASRQVPIDHGALPGQALEQEAAGHNVESLALAALEDESTERLLATLTDDQREVIALRIIADLSINDVAAIVDKTPAAVKRLQARGLSSLERTLTAQRDRVGDDGRSI